jgi:hypothetical protein
MPVIEGHHVLVRQLVQQRINILGVVVGDLANPFFGARRSTAPLWRPV